MNARNLFGRSSLNETGFQAAHPMVVRGCRHGLNSCRSPWSGGPKAGALSEKVHVLLPPFGWMRSGNCSPQNERCTQSLPRFKRAKTGAFKFFSALMISQTVFSHPNAEFVDPKQPSVDFRLFSRQAQRRIMDFECRAYSGAVSEAQVLALRDFQNGTQGNMWGLSNIPFGPQMTITFPI